MRLRSVPQQTNYDNYLWNGSAYVFSNRVRVGGFRLHAESRPEAVPHGRGHGRLPAAVRPRMGAGVRFIARTWGDLIDDVRTFRADGTINRQVVNYDAAERDYKGVQFTARKAVLEQLERAGQLHLLADRRQSLRRQLHGARRLPRCAVPHDRWT